MLLKYIFLYKERATASKSTIIVSEHCFMNSCLVCRPIIPETKTSSSIISSITNFNSRLSLTSQMSFKLSWESYCKKTHNYDLKVQNRYWKVGGLLTVRWMKHWLKRWSLPFQLRCFRIISMILTLFRKRNIRSLRFKKKKTKESCRNNCLISTISFTSINSFSRLRYSPRKANKRN